jgi:hypothetical protein
MKYFALISSPWLGPGRDDNFFSFLADFMNVVSVVQKVSVRILKKKEEKEKTPWPQSASELYRPSDRRLSAKLVPTFCG